MKPFPKLISNLRSGATPLSLSMASPKTIIPKGGILPRCRNSTLFRLLQTHELDEACRVFAEIPSPDLRTYTAMITALSRADRLDEAFHLFDTMPTRDIASWNSMIKGCFDCGHLNLAQKLFDEMPRRNVISWTTMITGFARFGKIGSAEELFGAMPQRDSAAWNSMVSGYCSNGRVADACALFERMPSPNVISWTAIIGGYDQNGESSNALILFQKMMVSTIKPTSSTFACALTACANISDLCTGIQLHAHLTKNGYLFDTFVSTSLVTMYANCKQIDSSSKIFHEIGDRNVVSWTALITGYGLNARHKDALNEFYSMCISGIRPNQSTVTSALNSCCGLEVLDRGKKIHSSTIKQGLDANVFVGNSLVVMYSKCGDIDEGLKVFDKMSKRNLVSWNSIIVGCAQNGYASLALVIFDDMTTSLVQPDAITFIGLLNACSHCRMPEKGRYFFRLLKENPSVDVKIEHYVCMVDVLGRSGNLEEAEDLIRNMPMRPNATVWLALLSACRVHSNVELARRTSKMIFDLDQHNSAAYVLLSNIYASAGQWNDVSQVRVMMRCQGIVKLPGCSWITLKDCRHEFVCGDRSHPMTKEIYKKLEWLGGKLKEYGYVYDNRFALHDVDDEQKEAMLTFHSEKLAIAFGLICSIEGSKIRVIKNLRACGDCHSSIKLISKILGREIVLRDSSRFHHFKEGFCSCGDYW